MDIVVEMLESTFSPKVVLSEQLIAIDTALLDIPEDADYTQPIVVYLVWSPGCWSWVATVKFYRVGSAGSWCVEGRCYV